MTELPLISTVQDAVLQMMATQAPQIILIGRNLFFSFAAIKIGWFGFNWMLGGGHPGDRLGAFAELILMLSIGYSMLVFYDSPIPGMNESFSELIPQTAMYLARLFDLQAFEQTSYALDLLGSRFAAPTAWNVLLNILFGLLWVVLYGLKAAVLVVSVGPLIMVSMLIMFGPLCVACFVVEPLSFIFQGWLRAMLTCAFYQPFGLAFVFLLAKVVERMVSTWPETIPPEQFLLYFGQLTVVAFSFCAGLVLIPRVVGMVFGGGSSPTVAIGSAIRTAGAAATALLG